MDDSWHSGQSLLHHPNRNIVLFSNPPRTDYSHHQQIHPLAVQQHNHPPFGASTSRNAALVASAEAAPQNECVTAWEPLQLRQEWTIHNFTKALDLATFGTCMRSRNFRDESMPDICWQLCLYPGGKREENSGNVSLFLKMSTTENQREFTVRAEYRFYFLDDTGAARFSNVNTGDFKVKPAKGSHSWGLRNIPRQKVLNCIRSNNSLHIVCQIELVPDFNKLQTHVRREHRIDPIIVSFFLIFKINLLIGTGFYCLSIMVGWFSLAFLPIFFVNTLVFLQCFQFFINWFGIWLASLTSPPHLTRVVGAW
uniref:MATH domain-containing protein n=1 Tax=Meloidogyne incognita TaxID=6306 RepID=A0A914MQ66_MELIC